MRRELTTSLLIQKWKRASTVAGPNLLAKFLAPRPGLEPGTCGLTVVYLGIQAGNDVIPILEKSSSCVNSTAPNRICPSPSATSNAIICAIK